jgi:hypothetical protein
VQQNQYHLEYEVEWLFTIYQKITILGKEISSRCRMGGWRPRGFEQKS